MHMLENKRHWKYSKWLSGVVMLPTYIVGVGLGSGLGGWKWLLAAFVTLFVAATLYENFLLNRDWKNKTAMAAACLFLGQILIYGLLIYVVLL